MKLLIVESPNKIKKLKSFLDDSWTVSASVGHICDLPDDEMGIDLEKAAINKYNNKCPKCRNSPCQCTF